MDTGALEALLAAGEWRAADDETRRLLLGAGDQGGFAGLESAETALLDCALLKAIDRSWSNATEGRYGIEVQSRILAEIRGEGLPRKTTWRLFGLRVGWVDSNGWAEADDVLDMADGPPGHLPWIPGTMPTVATGRTYDMLFEFYKRFDECAADG